MGGGRRGLGCREQGSQENILESWEKKVIFSFRKQEAKLFEIVLVALDNQCDRWIINHIAHTTGESHIQIPKTDTE